MRSMAIEPVLACRQQMVVMANRRLVDERFDLVVGQPRVAYRTLTETEGIEGVPILAHQPNANVREFDDGITDTSEDREGRCRNFRQRPSLA